MIIKLPDQFLYYGDGRRSLAYVSNGELFLRGAIDYESLMYTLSYVANGYERCFYCGEDLVPENRTLDHMYSRAYGGISLPNNLSACCRKCNEEKRDMSIDQYYTWLGFSEGAERDAYYQKTCLENAKIFKSGKFVLPDEWVTQCDVSNLRDENLFKDIISEGKTFKKLYERHGMFPRPIVVTANGAVIEGMHSVFLAYKHHVATVPAIILENAQKIDFP